MNDPLDRHRRWQVVWTPDLNGLLRRPAAPAVVVAGFDKRDEAVASADRDPDNDRLAVRENPDWCATP